MKTYVPHPIPYQGSKRNIADQIICHFPKHSKRLVEPFTGSAAISLAAAVKSLADSFWLNDAHEPIVSLWKAIVEQPEQLVEGYTRLWHDQEGRDRVFYDEVRAEFNKTKKPTAFLYLLARCVKAAIRYNTNGEFNNSPDKRRKGATPSNMGERVLGASKLFEKRTCITCLDYREVLAETEDTDLIYMDPPYQGVSGKRDNRYSPTINHAEFCDALAGLVKRKMAFVVSYDGRLGDKTYGEPMPESLGLTHLEIDAGPSSQATLLGRNDRTYESLYLSPALVAMTKKTSKKKPTQQSLPFGEQEESAHATARRSAC